MTRTDWQLVSLGLAGLIATIAMFAPLPVGCFGLLFYFLALIGLAIAATTTTYRAILEKPRVARYLVIAFLWVCVAAMLPLGPLAVHFVGWVWTR